MLSGEELFALLRLMRVTAIPGFDTTWACAPDGELTPRGRDSIGPALRALAARGYLQTEDGGSGADGERPRAAISPVVFALVGVCARSASTARVVTHTPSLFGEFFLHYWGELGAYHTSDVNGVHTFIPLDGREGVIQLALALAGLTPGVTPPLPGWRSASLPKFSLERAALAGVRGDELETLAALADSPLDPSLCDGLARTLLANDHVSEITLASRRDGAVTERLAFITMTPEMAWVFVEDGAERMMRLLGPDGASILRRWLEGALPG